MNAALGTKTAAASDSFTTLAVGALILLGAVGGVSLAMGELDAFFIALSVIGAGAVLYDFRFGAVLLVLLLPMSESTVFPHSILGLTGLNPMNLLVAATLVSCVARSRGMNWSQLVPSRLVWMFVVPVVIAGFLGSRHVNEIPAFFYDTGGLNFTDAAGYLRDFMLKPLVMVVVAVLLGAAVSRAQKPERFIIPIVASVWIMVALEIGYVIASGATLRELASANERTFFNVGIGMHANDLGRLYAIAYGLMLFIWWETKSATLKTVLMATMGAITVALLLTFSRGAFLGFMIVNLLFLMWKFNAKTLALAVLALIIAAAFLPGAFYDRIMIGFEGGGDFNEVSAGRIDGIWLPLLPELFKSPLWGNGLGSIMWSFPMRAGLMLDVGHPHNAYIEAALDLGFAGLVLLVGYYVHVWKGFRALGSNAYLSPEMRGLFQGATAGLVSFAITGLAGSSLVPKPEYVFLWLAIGMMYGQLARKPGA